jgi:hypothetical protein
MVLKIPPKHILKRWTEEVRDILPAEFLMYQKYQGPPKNARYGHSRLDLQDLKLVQQRDVNVESY